MAFGDDALLTWAEMKAYLPTLTDADQTFGELLIEAASVLANRYAERKLKARDITDIVHGSSGYYLVAPQFPINSVASVKIDKDGAFGAGTEVTDYRLMAGDGLLYRASGWGTYPLSIQIVYNAGYSETPADLQLAIVETFRWNWFRLRQDRIGVKSVRGPEGIDTAFELTIPVNAQRVFESYRDGRVA